MKQHDYVALEDFQETRVDHTRFNAHRTSSHSLSATSWSAFDHTASLYTSRCACERFVAVSFLHTQHWLDVVVTVSTELGLAPDVSSLNAFLAAAGVSIYDLNSLANLS